MMQISPILNQLTDKELMTCFLELDGWRKTGVLKTDGMVRAIHEDCENKIDAEIDLRTIESQLLYYIGEKFIKSLN